MSFADRLLDAAPVDHVAYFDTSIDDDDLD
nr:hypothetical protein [Frigoribacterium sp. PvP032]